MADQKISGLPSATTPLSGTEVIPLVQSGTTKNVPASNFARVDTAQTFIPAQTFDDDLIVALKRVLSHLGNWPSSDIGTGDNRHAFGGTDPVVLFLNEGTSAAQRLAILGLLGGTDEGTTHAAGYYIEGGTFDGTNNSYLRFRQARSGITALDLDANGNVSAPVGNLVIGTSGKGIDFSATSDATGMTSELLDDYEEGTWTPTTTNLTVNSGSASWSGKYTKVGRLVTAYFILSGGNFTITQGSTTISLPFTATGYETGLIVNPNTGVGNYGFGVASGNAFGYVGTTATGTGFSGSVTYMV